MRVLATHSIRQFPLHFPTRASPCATRFRTSSTTYTAERERRYILLHVLLLFCCLNCVLIYKPVTTMYEILHSHYMLRCTKLKFLDIGQQMPLKVRAIHLFDMSKDTDLSTQHHIPKDLNSQQVFCENLKSH